MVIDGEPQALVLYDIEDDRTRERIAETCKDYGLERIQFSAFAGPLSRNRREELVIRLGETLGEKKGNILVQPVCGKDFRDGRQIVRETSGSEDENVSSPSE